MAYYHMIHCSLASQITTEKNRYLTYHLWLSAQSSFVEYNKHDLPLAPSDRNADTERVEQEAFLLRLCKLDQVELLPALS